MELFKETTTQSVHECVQRLVAELERRSIPVLATIDHAAAARAAGLELPDETVVVFGNPRAGTPLMQADPEVGIELPLRILVCDVDGTTMLGCHDPMSLLAEYHLGEAALGLRQMRRLLVDLMSGAAGARAA